MRSTKRCGPEMVEHLRDEKTLPLFDIKLELSTRQVDLLSRRAQAHATAPPSRMAMAESCNSDWPRVF
jgi:hypothetical protein